MDKSWVNLDRRSDEYRNKLELFLNEAFAKSARNDKIICPCKRCCNRYLYDRITVGGHLLWHGMDPLYMTARWTHHGESYIDHVTEGESHINLVHDNMQTNIDNEGGRGEMHEFLNETFVQPIIGQTIGSSSQPPIFEGQTPESERFYKLLDDANTELYPGSKYKKLDAIVKLCHIKCLGNVSNTTFSLFLEAFKDMLPEGNCMPKSSTQAKKFIDELGLSYEKIDACPNDCMLFWKDTLDMNECCRCGASRYKVNKSGDVIKQVSAKVLRYFPLIPRLKRLYMSKYTAEHMRWHSVGSSSGGFMKHPVDSQAWKHLDSLYPDFASEIRNVRLGLACDGFNPFSNMSSKHSTWPVIISIYNLPPWMCMKQPYLLMSLLIPGPREPGNDIDVYMQPLIDELKELWEVGTSTYDVFSNQTFNMRAVVLWTINDLPAYANLSGWSTSGKLACPYCNHKTCSVRLPNCKKQGYLGHRKFLPITHRFRIDAKSFNGKCENDVAPMPLTGMECLTQQSNLRFTFGKTPTTEKAIGQRKRSSNATREARVTGPWKKKSIFFTLPYWQHLLIRHNIDVMHVDENVSENILGTLLDTSKKGKDGLDARADLEILKIRKALHPIREGNRTYIPPSIFFMTNEEKMMFCKVLSTVRVPDGYSANIARCVDVKGKKYKV